MVNFINIVNNFFQILILSFAAVYANSINAQHQRTNGLINAISELLEKVERSDCRFTSHLYGRIGRYYANVGMSDSALHYYRLGAKSWIKSRIEPVNRCAVPVADDLIQQKKYDSAIHYLRWRNSKIDNDLRVGHPTFYWHHQISYRLMLAYNGLGLVDSAIHAFMPYIFMEWTDAEGVTSDTSHTHKNDYHCQLNDFLTIISNKFNKQELFCRVNNPAIREQKYNLNGREYIDLYLYVVVFGKEILFEKYTVHDVKIKNEDILETKCYLLESYQRSLLYMWAKSKIPTDYF